MQYFLGYDTKESEAFSVALHSIQRMEPDLSVAGLHLPSLREAGWYTRPTSRRDGRLWDDISEAYMATEHANSRFLTPFLADASQELALFTDCDILAFRPISEIAVEADDRYAVQVVKHHYQPKHGAKMDGQAQQLYARKNWSSVMLWNLRHPAHKRLTLDMVNGLPGRDLHRFCWLEDDEIGDLHPGWNWLVGHSSTEISPRIVHYTEGLPSMAGYDKCAYADNWFSMRRLWLDCGFNSIGESGDGRNMQ
jgi:hypothetical protein